MQIRHIVIPVLAVIMLTTAGADAQVSRSWKQWYGSIQVGYVMPQGDTDLAVEKGWNIKGGATYMPSDWKVGLYGNLAFGENDLTRRVLDYAESSGGDVDTTSLTLGVYIPFETSGPVGFYLKGGIGATYMKVRLKEPATICGPICDPWYWWWCWWGCVPGSVITDSYSTTEASAEIAVGITYDVGLTTELYFEAAYQYVNTKEATEFIPLSIGLRW